MKNNQLELGQESIGKLLLKYSVPAIIGMMVNALYNVVDRIFIGNIPGVGPMATISSIALIFLMPSFGINQGMQPIVGFNFGAKKYDRAVKTLKICLLASTVIFIIGFILIQFVPQFLVGMFNNDQELMAITINGLKKYALTMPLLSVAVIGTNYIQSTGKAKLSILLSLLRQCILLIPLIMILPKYFGLDGVWFAQPVSDMLSVIIILSVLVKEVKKYNKDDKGTLAA